MRTLALIYLLTELSLFGQPANLFPGAAYVATQTAASGTTYLSRWPMTEGSGTTLADSTGHGYNITLENNPSWQAGPNGANALSFNGSTQYGYTATALTPMGGVQHASFSAWVHVASYSSSVFTLSAIDANNYPFTLSLFGGTVYCGVGNGTNNFPSVSATASWNGWHCVALTFDGTQSIAANRVVLYLDGTPLTLVQDSGNPSALGSSINLNVSKLGVHFLFGYEATVISDIIIDTNTWTQAKVASIFTAGAQ